MSSRYTQFGTKLSPLFGFAKSSKYKTNFKLCSIPKSLLACVTGNYFVFINLTFVAPKFVMLSPTISFFLFL